MAQATRHNHDGRPTARREHLLEGLRQEFESLFGRMGGWLGPLDQEFRSLRLWDFDVIHDDEELVVRVDLPGFEQNELDVKVQHGVLTINAEKESERDRRACRSFYRTILLPPGIDADRVAATYHNGVLELHLPRAEGARPRRINVEAEPASRGSDGREAMHTWS